MGKRDIRVNYDILEVIEEKLKTYRDGLDTLRSSMNSVNNLIVQNSEADSIEKLEKRYKKAKKRLDECYEEADALYNLINGYRNEMTSIIKSKGGMTRVGRNDVYWNMKSVCNAIEDIEDVKSCHMIIPSLEIGKTEEEIQAMQRNYDKIHDTIWGVIFPQMKQDVSRSYKKLKDYYSNEITDYENKDDEYKKKSEAIRAQYSSPWELFKQCGIDIVETVWKVLKGAAMAVVDLIKGLYSIGNMIYYSASGGVAAIAYLVCPETPKWANDALGESEEYFGNIAYALSHPVETIESMAQSTSDTYEKEGLTYMASYVIADVLLGKAMGGAGKTDEMTDVAGATGKVDDVADVAEESRHVYDDLDNLDDLDELEDFYERMYEPYYKEQFDPVAEGAIADPKDIDDAVKSVDDVDVTTSTDDVTEVAGKGDKYSNGKYTGGRTEKELKDLAKDPAHSGSTRPIDIAKGKHEAKVGLDLEERGELTNITRDPTGKAEFIDGNGQTWDVKSFNSNYKPSKGGFRIDKAMKTIKKSLSENENVIVDTSNMSKEHIIELKKEIKKQGLEEKILFWP